MNTLTELNCSGCRRKFVLGEVIYGVYNIARPDIYICSPKTLPSRIEVNKNKRIGRGFLCAKCFMKIGGLILSAMKNPEDIELYYQLPDKSEVSKL
jgi:hypothetical protein